MKHNRFHQLVVLFGAVIMSIGIAFALTAGAQGTTTTTPGDIILQIYFFALSVGGLLAVGMIVWGGVQYITSAGNSGKQSDARDRILQALMGLLLLVGSYIVLNTINPDIVKLTLPTLPYKADLNKTEPKLSPSADTINPEGCYGVKLGLSDAAPKGAYKCWATLGLCEDNAGFLSTLRCTAVPYEACYIPIGCGFGHSIPGKFIPYYPP